MIEYQIKYNNHLPNRRVCVVMYHYVRPISASSYPLIKGLEIEKFERQLDYIQNNYSVISVLDLVNYTNSGLDLPTNSIILTFDDGYSDHFNFVYPSLLRRKISGVFFPPVMAIEKRKVLDVNKIQYIIASVSDIKKLIDYIDNNVLNHSVAFNLSPLNEYHQMYMHPSRYDSAGVIYVKRMLQHALPFELRQSLVSKLFNEYVTCDELGFAEDFYVSENELKEMLNNGMEIGGHGYTHEWLNKLSSDLQRDEVLKSFEMLKRIGVKDSNLYFCYPYGAYNSESLNILKSCNCAVAFTTQVGLHNTLTDNPLEIPRLDTNDIPIC